MTPNKFELNGGGTPKLLHQLDLTAGYHAIHRIDTFSPRLVDVYRKLLPYGGRVPRVMGPFRVSINGPRFTIFHRECEILEGGIGIGRDWTWIELHNLIKNLDWTLEARPRPGLWLAEVPLPSVYKLKRKQTFWIFNFLRHLAAAMITSDSNNPGTRSQ